jgi:flagellar biosynthesis protein FlhF
MKIKTFKARTFSEALDLVKKELSEDAVILSSEERKGLLPCVEVTAAVDYDLPRFAEAPAGTQAAAAARPAARTGAGAHPVASSRRQTRDGEQTAIPFPANDAAPSRESMDQIRNELGSLRQTIETMRKNGFELALPPQKRKAYAMLRRQAVREEYALRLCEHLKDLGDLPHLVSADLAVRNPHHTRKAVMFVGPTGAGKTTTIAKLAAQAVKAGKKTAIINLDTYRIGAVEQIRIYARILGIPLAVATSGEEFRNTLASFTAERDLVFIDTTGRNPRDDRSLAELAELCAVNVPLEVHLLMGANTDDEFLIDAYRSYSRLPLTYIAFSKVDEAVRYGTLYNLALTYQKPVSYLTTGQRVPGDIEPATVGRLAGLILPQRDC